MSWGSKSSGSKGGGKGAHREPKTWGGSKPPKVPKSGKHAKGKGGGKSGKGGAADGLDKWG